MKTVYNKDKEEIKLVDTEHPFYIQKTLNTDSKDSVDTYVKNNFSTDIFPYGISVCRISTSSGGGTAVVIADKHTADGKYGAFIMFGYGYSLKSYRCINGTWY